MGLFGRSKKNHKDADAAKAAPDTVEETPEETATPEEVQQGPWDSSEAPESGKFLDLGSLRLPARDGITLRLQVNKDRTQVTGVTVTFEDSSLEVAPIAAPKTAGIWDEIRAELLSNDAVASETEGTFGQEITSSVTVKGGKKIPTRIVGVDGPRWMLRGIFTGKAAQGGAQKEALDSFFQGLVVDRDDTPLAPRDPLPLHPPVQHDEETDNDDDAPDVPSKPEGPLTPMQNVDVHTTLSRGPMFSEVR